MMDAAAPLYPVLDWTRCVVGGSHALQQFTRDVSWMPGDIDIHCALPDMASLLKETDRLVHQLPGARITKTLEVTDEMRRAPRTPDMPDREEKFHESICGNVTLQVPGVPVPVTLVAHRLSFFPTLEALLDRATDTPACVSYRITTMGGERGIGLDVRMFHSRRGDADYIWKRKPIPVDLICAARKDKYKARGYEFV